MIPPLTNKVTYCYLHLPIFSYHLPKIFSFTTRCLLVRVLLTISSFSIMNGHTLNMIPTLVLYQTQSALDAHHCLVPMICCSYCTLTHIFHLLHWGL